MAAAVQVPAQGVMASPVGGFPGATTVSPKRRANESPEVRAAVDRFTNVSRKWCEDVTNKQVDWWNRPQGIMASVHLLLWNAIANQYRLAHLIEQQDMNGWLQYCTFTFDMINHHHHLEEDYYFPQMVEACPEFKQFTDKNISQHHEFHSHIDSARTYFNNCLTSPQTHKYDPNHHLDLLDGFLSTLMTHLDEELDTLAPENLKRLGYKLEDINKISENVHKIAQKEDPTKTLPMMLGHLAGDMGGIPTLVILLTKLVFSRKHAEAWKFCVFSPFLWKDVKYPGGAERFKNGGGERF